MDAPVLLYVSVPVASFRVPQAREFLETLPFPPPATVYGMLLSLVGEPDRLVHEGAEIATGLLSKPERSVVLRTVWRVKSTRTPPGMGSNKRPDFQELLTNVRLTVAVRRGSSENEKRQLAERLDSVLKDPGCSPRFGALCLGESTYLVDEVRTWRRTDGDQAIWLMRDPTGELTLPIWVDHVGSARTVWERYRLEQHVPTGALPPDAWTTIQSLRAKSTNL
jgi:CRISPR-associated protein Cas5t